MREIKFRALKDDMSDYNFVYGNLIYQEGTPRIQENNASALFTTCTKGTVGQFTGELDKNGKEIYEGDIIKDPDGSHGVVVWHIAAWAVKWSDGDGLTDLIQENSIGEVVGNEFQHPDLLK